MLQESKSQSKNNLYFDQTAKMRSKSAFSEPFDEAIETNAQIREHKKQGRKTQEVPKDDTWLEECSTIVEKKKEENDDRDERQRFHTIITGTTNEMRSKSSLPNWEMTPANSESESKCG